VRRSVSEGGMLVAAAVLASTAAVATRGQQDGRPWPPGVQMVQPESPPLTPEQELATFHLAPGYRLELVASEPLVQDPVAIDWAPDGRLWVVEMPGFMPDIAATGEHEPIGRIVALEDADGDGRMDRRTVFADGLVLARSVKVLEHGVLVAEPPDVWLMRDTDGDLRMDTKTRLTSQFGQRDVDVENNANGFDWSLDNRLRTAGQSRLEFRWKAGTLLAIPAPVRGQWGVTHDDVGRAFRNTNESALHVDLVADEYFARHPQLLRTRGSYERLATPDNDLNTVWPVRPTPGINRGYQAGVRRPDGTLARYTSVCAPLVYRGDRLPVSGSVFVADPAANVVSRIDLREEGATLRAAKPWADAEFLASTDERFRPVYFSNAPDGALYLVDLYRGVVEHRLSLTTYLKSYIEAHRLLEPRGYGRIWRIVHDGQPRDTAPMQTRSAEDLVAQLSHPNGWRRDTSQRLLVERGDAAIAPVLATLARDAREPRTRLHALWTLDGLDAVTVAHVDAALRDPSPHVRAAGVRVAERWLDAPTPALRAMIAAALEDADPLVRLQAAASLGALPDDDGKWSAMAQLLAGAADDPVLMDVALTGVRGAESRVLARLVEQDPRVGASAGAPLPPSSAAIAMVSATLFRAAREQDAQQWLARIADLDPNGGARSPSGDARRRPGDARPADATPPIAQWQREALMHGAEIGILGAPVPGQPAPLQAASGVTCPTCPGGRQSAGGDYAFEWPASADAYTRPGTATPPLRLRRSPEAFVRLSEKATPFGKQAAAVLTRITWPGKAGDADAPPPLTATEQQRFDAGQRIYEAMCQACHQADGRGQPGRAPSLVGSPLALAPADVPVRILLNGKEGSTGLMPPIGVAMSDVQIASVLTYVRREWGHGGTAVDPDVVTRQRSLSRGRTRPWTDAELIGERR
jgi:mono/diheme cytochrome c family protein/glucose/arabinose dehydrogenase